MPLRRDIRRRLASVLKRGRSKLEPVSALIPDALSDAVRGLGESATVASKVVADARREQGLPVYALGLGQSPFPVPYEVVEALRRHAAEKDYLPSQGLKELRDAVADFHVRHDKIQMLGEGILNGPGSKELMFLLQIVMNADLLVLSPSWVSYGPQAQLANNPMRRIPTSRHSGWRLTAPLFEAACQEGVRRGRAQILILNYPTNPHGGSYSEQELQELARIARKYKVLILSDEIYGHLHYLDEHISIARYYPEGTIISSGISKWCGAGGWRLGTFAFPPNLYWLRDKMVAAASETYTSVSAPIQHAAVTAFLESDEIDCYLLHSRKILSMLAQEGVSSLRAHGVQVHAPEGGFYLFPDFSADFQMLRKNGITTSREFRDRLLDDTGVVILPGAEFGRPLTEFTARLAFVDFDGKRALEESMKLGDDAVLTADFVATHCANTIHGITAIGEWLEGLRQS